MNPERHSRSPANRVALAIRRSQLGIDDARLFMGSVDGGERNIGWKYPNGGLSKPTVPRLPRA